MEAHIVFRTAWYLFNCATSHSFRYINCENIFKPLSDPVAASSNIARYCTKHSSDKGGTKTKYGLAIEERLRGRQMQAVVCVIYKQLKTQTKTKQKQKNKKRPRYKGPCCTWV